MLFSCFSISTLYSQVSIGEYCSKSNTHRDCFNFIDSNKFSYIHSGCLGRSAGYGTYQIINDSLILSFKDSLNLNSRFFYFTDSTDNNQDSIELHLFITDLENKPMYGVKVELLATRKNNKDDVIKSFYLNKYGAQKIKLERTNKKVWIKISNLGWDPFYVNFKPTKNFNFRGKVDKDKVELIKDRTSIYEIRKNKKEKLFIIDGQGENTRKLELFKVK